MYDQVFQDFLIICNERVQGERDRNIDEVVQEKCGNHRKAAETFWLAYHTKWKSASCFSSSRIFGSKFWKLSELKYDNWNMTDKTVTTRTPH